MSVYIASRGDVSVECDMAYTKFKDEGGYYVPCEIKGAPDIECVARGLGLAPGECASSDVVILCKRPGGLAAKIRVNKAVEEGVTPGEIVKQLLLLADFCIKTT